MGKKNSVTTLCPCCDRLLIITAEEIEQSKYLALSVKSVGGGE